MIGTLPNNNILDILTAEFIFFQMIIYFGINSDLQRIAATDLIKCRMEFSEFFCRKLWSLVIMMMTTTMMSVKMNSYQPQCRRFSYYAFKI